MNTSVAKKAGQAVRLLMMVLTAVLIFFFINVMLLVSDIQGTARVVNYAGLVRGTTQRIVKLEDAGQPQDDLLKAVDSYINGLRYGSDDLNLVRLDDDEYQAKMTELANYFDELCAEIIRVREVGYENTDIISMSEEFFGICDDATRLAEDYSQEKASALNYLEGLVIIDIVGLVATFAVELVRAVRTAALNRELQSKVYLDEATGLPNKNKCEEILGQEQPVSAEAPVAVCVFDLNNLHTVNNNFGHEKGDEYIRSFAQQLGRVASETCFVGRDGGDEFIAVLRDADRADDRSAELLCVAEIHLGQIFGAQGNGCDLHAGLLQRCDNLVVAGSIPRRHPTAKLVIGNGLHVHMNGIIKGIVRLRNQLNLLQKIRGGFLRL